MQHKNTPPHHQELDFNEGTCMEAGRGVVCMYVERKVRRENLQFRLAFKRDVSWSRSKFLTKKSMKLSLNSPIPYSPPLHDQRRQTWHQYDTLNVMTIALRTNCLFSWNGNPKIIYNREEIILHTHMSPLYYEGKVKIILGFISNLTMVT